jgi:hypothetical protein
MIKVTPNDNLVPCPCEWTRVHPYSDLTYNVLHARRLIRYAMLTLQLKKEHVVFSGYIRENPDLFFRIELHHQGLPYRSVVLSELGYAGLLRVELTSETAEEAFHFDVLGSLAILGNPAAAISLAA